MNNLKAKLIIIALIALAPLSPFAGRLVAQDLDPMQSPDAQHQTVEEATALLTTGHWRFHGVKRKFHPDGTFTSSNGNAGVWRITEDQLEVSLGDLQFRFFLPINPKGTRGELDKHSKNKMETKVEMLEKVP